MDRTISLRSDLVERLETLAQTQGRTIDDVFDDLLEHYLPPAGGNWAIAVAEGMEAANIEWRDDPDASTRSREQFEQHLREKWLRIQNPDTD
ncbi:MAG: hypothetical protein ABI835_00425 [Chloroflexota bacterium]